MLFHKKEKAPEGQQAGTKPEKPRKVRWSERREPSEAGPVSYTHLTLPTKLEV